MPQPNISVEIGINRSRRPGLRLCYAGGDRAAMDAANSRSGRRA